MNHTNIRENAWNFISDGHFDTQLMFDYTGVAFFKIFKAYPKNFKIYIDNDEKVQIHNALESFEKIEKSLKYNIDMRFFITEISKMRYVNTFTLSENDYLVFGGDGDNLDSPHFMTTVHMSDSEDRNMEPYINMYCESEYGIKNIIDCFRHCFKISDKVCKSEFGIATFGTSHLYTSYYDYTPKIVDIDLNYNDDFKVPYEKICDIIQKKDETGFVLLYGEPGTGKSTIIKNLISKYTDIEFVFMDSTLLASAPQNTLVSYFIENQNTVFILEDCEKVLLSREETSNPIISTILNVTDGIIGDVLGIKLICTFNTSLDKIDKALMRKGRLSLKYEFKKLKHDKVSKILGKEVKEDMFLADVYNMENENDYSKNERRKAGFGV